MEQEPANELVGRQGHDLRSVALAPLPPPEYHLAFMQGHEPVITEGDPVWSKNSCSLTLVVFQEASEPFTTLNGALTLAALAG